MALEKSNHISLDRARLLFRYEPETGRIINRTPRGRSKQGQSAATKRRDGYFTVCVDCEFYLAHRLIWFIVTGCWPDQIDHIDLDRGNNRWENLRNASVSQNMANRKAHRDNSCGHKGVAFHPQTGKWRARIYHNHKSHHIGLFVDLESAGRAYQEASFRFNGEFARA